MLFPDPSRAATAVRNALVPGGRFAALVFTTPSNNPFMAGPMDILLRFAQKAPPARGAPGIFALGAPGRLRSTISECGFADVTTAVAHLKLSLASTPEALEMMRSAFGVYRAVVADLSDTERDSAWSKVGEFLSQFETDTGWETELEVVIGSGSASA